MKYIITLCAVVLAFPWPVQAGEYPGDTDIIGEIGHCTIQAGESLIELARRYDVGYEEIAAANRSLDPFVPKAGTTAIIPTARIVPRTVEPGTILVNLSEMRLYYPYYREGVSYLATFPIGIGSEGTSTPLGTYRITGKQTNPEWHVPASIRKEKPELPDVVPAGPDNPLGSHALRLSSGGIMIHGTNRPLGVGRRVSHGCIRLYPEDIPRLFELASVGTTVVVVREPVKVGMRKGRVFLEVHRDDDFGTSYLREAERLLEDKWVLDWVSRAKLLAALREKSGVPVDITE